jgi:hypothetical protein
MFDVGVLCLHFSSYIKSTTENILEFFWKANKLVNVCKITALCNANKSTFCKRIWFLQLLQGVTQ